ncbi:MAG: hypothetical protein AAFN07_06835 [Pseudomonadota bacterium]
MRWIHLWTLMGLTLLAGQSHANTVVPGDYFVLDHPNGALSSAYGLRLDILDPPAGTGPTFSTTLGGARVVLSWDGSGTATLSGTIFNNQTGRLWTVNHLLTGVVSDGSGFIATGGVMTVGVAEADQALYGATVFTFYSVPAGGDAFVAAGDSHRCGSDSNCGPLIARGWLNIDGNGVAQNDGSVEDWLVQLKPVPLPAAVWLLISALGAFRVTTLLRK